MLRKVWGGYSMRKVILKASSLLLLVMLLSNVNVYSNTCVNGYCTSTPSVGHGSVTHTIKRLKNYVNTGKLYVRSFQENMKLYKNILNDLKKIKSSPGCTGSNWQSARQQICVQKYDTKIRRLTDIARTLDALEGKTRVVRQKMKEANDIIGSNLSLNDVDKTIEQLDQQIRASEAMDRSLERSER